MKVTRHDPPPSPPPTFDIIGLSLAEVRLLMTSLSLWLGDYGVAPASADMTAKDAFRVRALARELGRAERG